MEDEGIAGAGETFLVSTGRNPIGVNVALGKGTALGVGVVLSASSVFDTGLLGTPGGVGAMMAMAGTVEDATGVPGMYVELVGVAGSSSTADWDASGEGRIGVASTTGSAAAKAGLDTGGERKGVWAFWGDDFGGVGDLLRPRSTLSPAFWSSTFLGSRGTTGSREIASYAPESKR